MARVAIDRWGITQVIGYGAGYKLPKGLQALYAFPAYWTEHVGAEWAWGEFDDSLQFLQSLGRNFRK